jgi:Mg-chelatase subunit ChlD
VVLTDGRANVALTPTGDPRADAVQAARLLAARCNAVTVEHTAPRFRAGDTDWLAAALEQHPPTPE